MDFEVEGDTSLGFYFLLGDINSDIFRGYPGFSKNDIDSGGSIHDSGDPV